MSNMKTLNQHGGINALLVPLVLMILLFAGATGFGIWAFNSRQDYKNNSDQKAAVAVDAAVEEADANAAALYAEREKQPYDTFTGDPKYGTVRVQYPKTWSAYVVQTERDSNPIRGYFYPNIVPDVSNQQNAFALRVEMSQTNYDQSIRQYASMIEQGKATIAPVTLAKVPGVVGSRVEGQITSTKQGTMVIFPIRNMTLKVWTEDNQNFRADFDAHILPNLEFAP